MKKIPAKMANLIDQMLQFNPHLRPGVEDLLNHPAFDDILKTQCKAPYEIAPLDVPFDYKNGVCKNHNIDDLKFMLRLEINLIKSLDLFNTN